MVQKMLYFSVQNASSGLDGVLENDMLKACINLLSH